MPVVTRALEAERAADRDDALADDAGPSTTPSSSGCSVVAPGSTFSTAMSLDGSVPTSVASASSPFEKRTVMVLAPSTTCAFVTMWPSASSTKPEPSACPPPPWPNGCRSLSDGHAVHDDVDDAGQRRLGDLADGAAALQRGGGGLDGRDGGAGGVAVDELGADRAGAQPDDECDGGRGGAPRAGGLPEVAHGVSPLREMAAPGAASAAMEPREAGTTL